jgi:hypothetical protein
MIVDAEIAIWLAGLISQAVYELPHAPGLTIEVVGRPEHWMQIILETSEADGTLSGFLLNFPYAKHAGAPLDTFKSAGIQPPPGSRDAEWQDGGFARAWVRPDVPVVALAHLSGDILEKVLGALPDAEISVQIEYGF